MVYCGRPSPGCDACRARKVKCDQTRPSCNRCRKANRSCPGYRDQLSLWFRDESQSVVQKAKATGAALSGSDYYSLPPHARRLFSGMQNTDMLTSGETTEDPDRSDQSSSFPQTMQYTLPVHAFSVDAKFQATCFFFSTYAWLNAACLVHSSLDHSLTPTAALGEKALMVGIASVGMANLASLQHSRPLRLAARYEYIAALKLTNAALSDPVQAKEDATLTAIICLSLFEVITCKKPETMDAWIEHTRGAIALLELRGEEQLRRTSGLQMFHTLRSEILVGCMQRRTLIPPALVRLSNQTAISAKISPLSAYSDQLTNTLGRLCNLRYRQVNHPVVDDIEILSTAIQLDSDLATFVRELPPIFSYTTSTRADGQPFCITEYYYLAPHKGCFHIYESLLICNVWNSYRYGRIFVNEIILDQLRKKGTRSDSVFRSSDFRDRCRRIRDLMRQLAADICGTVPYQFGVVDNEKGEAQKTSTIKSSVGGFSLMFPLWMAASVDGHSSATYEWVTNTLWIIARAIGIDQALTLIAALPIERGIVGWVDEMDSESVQGRNHFAADAPGKTAV